MSIRSNVARSEYRGWQVVARFVGRGQYRAEVYRPGSVSPEFVTDHVGGIGARYRAREAARKMIDEKGDYQP